MSMRALTVTESVTLVTEECCSCGILFAVTKDFRRRCLEDRGERGKQFYCPNGHAQHYTGKTEQERANERAAELERQLASRNEDLRAAHLAAEDARRRHAATKGQLTKARRRADRGVCQHCNRSFVNVARHVAGQHPEAVDPS